MPLEAVWFGVEISSTNNSRQSRPVGCQTQVSNDERTGPSSASPAQTVSSFGNWIPAAWDRSQIREEK